MPFGWIRRTATLLLFAALVACEVQSQTTTSGALAGVVIDQTNSVVTNADITLRDNAKGTVQATKTDDQGVYRFLFLAPGSYTLTVGHPGFREDQRTATILLGPPVSINVTLTIAQARSDITVSGEAPLVQAENGDVSATMNQKQVSELPNPGNDVTYIVQTAPGVVMNTDVQGSANFSILGMPGFSYLHTMDGMNDNDTTLNLSLVGPLILLLGQNQIQEATIVSTGYAGQFGNAAGGNINYITKSGSNKLHGNAQYYWNGRAFNANNWFNNAFDEPRPFSIANQWAGSLGGPIKGNKLFFFFDTEGLRLLIPQQFFVTIPSTEFENATMANIDSTFRSNSATHAFYRKIFDLYKAAPGASAAAAGGFSQEDPAGCAGFSGLGTDPITGVLIPCARHFIRNRGRSSQDTLVSTRVDWNIRASDRIFVRAQYDTGGSAAFTDPISSKFDVDYIQPWWQGQVLETHNFGSSGASQFLLADSYFAPNYQPKDSAQTLAAFPAMLSFLQGPFNSLGSIFPVGFGKYVTQYQVSEDFAKIWRVHKFGVGANFSRVYWSDRTAQAGTIGQLTTNTLNAFYQGGFDPEQPETDFTSLFQSFAAQANRRISSLSFTVYGEDEWHARSNLTLTLALRAEHYSNPVCQSRCFARLVGPFASVNHDPAEPYDRAILINQEHAFESTEKILWSPRFSFAWQPFGVSHRTVVRGGAGIFYDPIPALIALSPANNPPLFNSYTIFHGTLSPQEDGSLFQAAADSNAAFIDGFSAGKTVDEIKAADPNFSPPGISVAERRTHAPRYQRWSLELQRAFGADTSLSIGYYGHHGIHELVIDPSTNAFGFGSLPAGLCTSPPIPPCADPRFRGVTQINTSALSNYSGLVGSFRHRFSRWTQGLFQANYTYGHALDESSGFSFIVFTGTSLTSPQDPNNLRGSYGSADHDVRHSFNANYVWDVPVKAALGGRGWDFLVNGWQVSGTIFARTAFPYTVFDFEQSASLAPNNYFGLLYAVPAGPLGPDLSCGRDAAFTQASRPCQPPQVSSDGFTPNPQARFIQSGCATGFNRGNSRRGHWPLRLSVSLLSVSLLRPRA